MADRKQLESQLDEILRRLDNLEERMEERSGPALRGNCGEGEGSGKLQYCSVPVQPPRVFGPEVSDERARAIISLGGKWVNGTPLHYYFFTSGRFGGDDTQQEVVRRAFKAWKDIGIGLTFTEVSSPQDAEIRIGFDHTDGSWSYVGTEVLNRGPSERTMNFGWNINVPGHNGIDTAIHEIGHTLGLHHEHQNPNAGIVWNEQAVYDYFARTQSPPWSRATTDHNILRKIDPVTVGGSEWDPNSIMHYPFEAGLIRSPAQYQTGLPGGSGLSSKDIQVVRQFYPDGGGAMVASELRPGESRPLTLAAGEQKDFNFIPAASRKYTFQTFGDADTVMVLFEDSGSELVYLTGDDDSGTENNARFQLRLLKGRKYRLKIRLYYRTSTGNTAVMVW